MDLDRRDRALTLGVAAFAVAGRVSERRFERSSVTRTLQRECVARSAVGARRGAEAFLGLLRGVLDPRLLFVTSRAALGFHASHRFAGELVTLGARYLLVDDVNLMAAGSAGGLPISGNVDAEPVGSARRPVTVGIGASGHGGHEQTNQEPDCRQVVRRTRHLGSHHSLGSARLRQQRAAASNPWRSSKLLLSEAGRPVL
jgi:hypothetical protein